MFVPLANRFFATHLVAFYALHLLPESARAWIDRVFYVWVSAFALFVVTVFWGFVTDLFRHEQGKRLFGFIAVGAIALAAVPVAGGWIVVARQLGRREERDRT